MADPRPGFHKGWLRHAAGFVSSGIPVKEWGLVGFGLRAPGLQVLSTPDFRSRGPSRPAAVARFPAFSWSRPFVVPLAKIPDPSAGANVCKARDVRSGSRPSGNVFRPPKSAHNQARWTSTRPSEPIFAVSSQESIRAQPRATQNDLNGHTACTTVHAPQARIAARSGLIPTMFITRVRL